MYIGSSKNLRRRLRDYFNVNLLISINMPIYKAILKYGHSSFSLDILEYCDPKDVFDRENYYLNLFKPDYNILQEAGSFKGYVHSKSSKVKLKAKPFYLYNRDKTILYYFSTKQKDFITNLKIHYVTFEKHLKNGTYYLDKYLFSRELYSTAKVKDISLVDLALMLEKDRQKYNKNKPINSLSKRVLLVDVNNSNNTKLLFSLGKCIEFLRNEGFPASQITLVKHINSGKPYYGYTCSFV